MDSIKFGTDGWRGIIARDFTFQNLRRCASGIGDYLISSNQASKGIIVGYDTRFSSEDFAAEAALVLASKEIPVYLCDQAAPTPVISSNINTLGAAGAIIITASHNPSNWNGLKFRPHYGGSASSEIVSQVEQAIDETHCPKELLSFEEAWNKDFIKEIDPSTLYLINLPFMADVTSILESDLHILVDNMHGTGAGYFSHVLSSMSGSIHELRSERNPIFPGMIQPEPIEKNLQLLCSLIIKNHSSVGIALDGDSDRLGIVNEKGKFITTSQVFSLLCLYQLEVLGLRGPLIRSVTMTTMIDKLASQYKVPIVETAVGFKHLGPEFLSQDGLAAGEESGGYTFRGNIPERDGILSGIMFLSLMAKTQKTPEELTNWLEEIVGPHYYDRWDLSFPPSSRKNISKRIDASNPSMLGGMKVLKTHNLDGFKFYLEDGFWCLIRFSGTEPLLRLYAEGISPRHTSEILADLKRLVGI